jgi:hypothetical protein
MKTVLDSNKVYDLKVYDDIDVFHVIEETLLTRGCDIVKNNLIHKDWLDDIALVVYGLKSNATNKLYVGTALDRLYRKHGLISTSRDKHVIVPAEIYEKVLAINNSYKQKQRNNNVQYRH